MNKDKSDDDDDIVLSNSPSNMFKVSNIGRTCSSTSKFELINNRKLLQSYNDKAFIMTILCTKSESFYNSISTCFTIILIITSTFLAITNSYYANNYEESIIKIISAVINCVNILLVSFNSQLKISQRASEFKLKIQSFNKLTHQIEMLLTNDIIEQVSVHNVISQYDLLSEHTDSFPGFIKRHINKKYSNYYEMPAIITSPLNLENKKRYGISLSPKMSV